jgi:hypothetical protein
MVILALGQLVVNPSPGPQAPEDSTTFGGLPNGVGMVDARVNAAPRPTPTYKEGT